MTFERHLIGYRRKGQGFFRLLKRLKPKAKVQKDLFLSYPSSRIGVKIRNVNSHKRKIEVKIRTEKNGKYEKWIKKPLKFDTPFGDLSDQELRQRINELAQLALVRLAHKIAKFPDLRLLVENPILVRPVLIVKHRRITNIGGVKIEQSKLKIGNNPRWFRTISVESSNLNKLKETYKELKPCIKKAIKSPQNTSYPKYLHSNFELF